jgi:hypothetical protein
MGVWGGEKTVSEGDYPQHVRTVSSVTAIISPVGMRHSICCFITAGGDDACRTTPLLGGGCFSRFFFKPREICKL